MNANELHTRHDSKWGVFPSWEGVNQAAVWYVTYFRRILI